LFTHKKTIIDRASGLFIPRYLLRFVTLMTILSFPHLTAHAQNVTCPDCITGLCEGTNLGDLLVFEGYTYPIEITLASGDLDGIGTNIYNYTITSGINNIDITFTEGDSTEHNANFDINLQTINSNFTWNEASGCNNVNFNGNLSTGTGGITNYNWTVSQIIGAQTSQITSLSGVEPSFGFPSGGLYEVCLETVNNFGCTDTYCEVIQVGQC